MSQKTQGIIRARDGTRLYFESHGKGRALVLSYGLLCRREHWRHQTSHFSKTHQVILWDYRGHQRSTTPENESHLTVQWCAWDLEDLCSHLGLSEVVLFGHSLGVAVVTEAAAMGQIPVKGCVLVCGVVQNPFQKMFDTNRMDQVFRLFSKIYERSPLAAEAIWGLLTRRGTFSHFLTAALGFNPQLSHREDVESYLEGVRQGSVHNFYRLLLDYVHFDGEPSLPKITCPTLVLAGADDLITPLQSQEAIAARLPNGRLRVVPMGSHNAHTDQPERVNEWIGEFLQASGYAS